MSTDLAEAVVDLAAVRGNLATIAAGTPARILAVVKADGFGHGAVPIARAALAAGAAWLGVTSATEALALRADGITAPILSWLHRPDADVTALILADVDISVSTVAHLRRVAADAARCGRVAHVHLKADTGLHRNGATSDDWPELLAWTRKHEHEGTLRCRAIWSHLATADQPPKTTPTLEDLVLNAPAPTGSGPIAAAPGFSASDPAAPKIDATLEELLLNAAAPGDAGAPGSAGVARQRAAFVAAVAEARAAGLTPELAHLANSAAAMTAPDTHFDLVRIGIGLYGIEPVPGRVTGLRPALTVRTSVINIKRVPAGSGVSYGPDHVTTRPTSLALLPIGYADGLPRAAEGRAQVVIAGRRCPIVGRIAMDQCVVDVGDLPVGLGDTAIVLGTGGPSATEWAAWAGTNPHEILTGIGPRVTRTYLHGE
ncbi:alanine racemase [Allocatelliglobosispora scoriae]|uniref:Alanine racemase n=1 Tax=Allocatelliglobosispora scoriae TaxID=643052 RepID=A0A841C4J7_9ACTN|nr:alanine racemase [Allocatelliglobosispora scoriae]MBB5873982.1 alanine racemase [Allocatelliglobosispora scoriae]